MSRGAARRPTRKMWKQPVTIANAEVPRPTARRILRLAKDGGLLSVLIEGSGRRGAVLIFPELLNIVEGGDLF